MKILFITSSMNAGGAERVASQLVNTWSSVGYQITLMPTYSGQSECFYQISPNVRLIYLRDLLKDHKKSFFKQTIRLNTLRQFIKTDKPDVIISFLSNVNVMSIIANFGLDIPLIICERTDPFIAPMPSWLKFACFITYPFATVLMVQTQSLFDKYIITGWPTKRLHAIANPIPLEFIDYQQIKRITSQKRLLSIGRLDAGKQFDVLIRIFSKLVKRHKNWSLRIIGDGTLRNDLQKQISELQLDAYIELVRPSSSIAEELSQADIFATTSKYEGFPNVLLEAMALGLPCITFDCPNGPKEITLAGQVALLIPLNDEKAYENALENLILDTALQERLGLEGCKSVLSRFSLDKIIKEWDILFKKMGINTQ